MSFINTRDKEINCKIAYFGPAFSGKTTTLRHIYQETAPGHRGRITSRTIILKGVDGVVFIVDSQVEKLEDNLESWKNLEKSLKNAGLDFKTIPIALQYNKRDLANRMPAEEFRTLFNARGLPEFETVATQGKNVMACFQAVAKKVLQELK
jgi:signal recognition particle receptor subunit beta